MMTDDQWKTNMLKEITKLKEVANRHQQRISKLEHDNSSLKERVRIQAGQVAFLKRKP